MYFNYFDTTYRRLLTTVNSQNKLDSSTLFGFRCVVRGRLGFGPSVTTHESYNPSFWPLLSVCCCLVFSFVEHTMCWHSQYPSFLSSQSMYPGLTPDLSPPRRHNPHGFSSTVPVTGSSTDPLLTRSVWRVGFRDSVPTRTHDFPVAPPVRPDRSPFVSHLSSLWPSSSVQDDREPREPPVTSLPPRVTSETRSHMVLSDTLFSHSRFPSWSCGTALCVV